MRRSNTTIDRFLSQGDSGGPIVTSTGLLVGVVSWGNGTLILARDRFRWNRGANALLAYRPILMCYNRVALLSPCFFFQVAERVYIPACTHACRGLSRGSTRQSAPTRLSDQGLRVVERPFPHPPLPHPLHWRPPLPSVPRPVPRPSVPPVVPPAARPTGPLPS
jgi:hypothetical protein